MHCSANRRSFDESSMNEKFYLKKIEVTRFILRFFPLITIEKQSKEWVSINRLKRYAVLEI